MQLLIDTRHENLPSSLCTNKRNDYKICLIKIEIIEQKNSNDSNKEKLDFAVVEDFHNLQDNSFGFFRIILFYYFFDTNEKFFCKKNSCKYALVELNY